METARRTRRYRFDTVKVSIIYDGQCPVCRGLVRATRLKERGAALELIDARERPLPEVQGRDVSGLDFDEGFAVIVDGVVYHGAAGARVLALLTEPAGIGFRVFRWMMRTEAGSRRWYPLLRAGRRALLRLLGVKQIREEQG